MAGDDGAPPDRLLKRAAPEANSATFPLSCLAVAGSGVKTYLVLPLVGVPHVQLTAVTVGANPIAILAEVHGGHLRGKSAS